jgi:FkbM family methyltransferase
MALPYPLVSSRPELEQYSFHRATGIYYGQTRMLCRLLGEYPAFVDTQDVLLAPRLILDGYWEAWVTLALARYVQEGFHCVDVGANYGYYSLLMAAACGPTGRVLACEPNPQLAESYLPQTLAVNGLADRVTICPKAIGDVTADEVEFVLHPDNLATSSLKQWAYSDQLATIRTPASTLDEELKHWSRVDLVKVDAEGAESLVWDGMRETRRRFPHVACAIELHWGRDASTAMAFMKQVIDEGYPLRFINYEAELAVVTPEIIAANPHEHWMLFLQK